MASAFDGCGQLALVSGAGARLPAGTNLSVFMDKPAQQVVDFVINHQTLIPAELAVSRAEKTLLPISTPSAARLSFILVVILFVHNRYSLGCVSSLLQSLKKIIGLEKSKR